MIMKKIDPQTLKKLLNDAGVAFMGIPTKEFLNYMPYGELIRNSLYTKAMHLLNMGGYQRVILSEKIYNWGPVYRTNKNTKFPFNLGERKSFLECYAVFKTMKEAEQELEFATNWNRRIIKDILHIPSVEVLRPVSTNKKISKRTICIDSITPLDETVITGMTYFHNDIFTKALNVKYKDQIDNRNKPTYSVHFGLSENILFSYLLNSCDGNNLRLYSFIAPIQVSILNALNNEKNDNIINNLIDCLKDNNITYNTEKIIRKKITSKTNENLKKGIPVTIILKNENGKMEIYSFYNGTQKLITTTNNDIDFDNIVNNIKILLNQNDKQITYDMSLKEKDSIVQCDNLSDLNEIVKSGKVAKIHLNNTDESVHKVESYLTGGEVLGFGLEKEQGQDIITLEKVDTTAFVSRRS